VSQIKLTPSQLKSVQEYCKLNNIDDVNKFITKCFTEGFNIKKFGLLSGDSGKPSVVEEKIVEIEVIREIRVEVPVEVIKEVIVEVPVTNTVETIVEVGKPNDKTKLLQDTLQKLRKELSEKNSRIKELEEINKQMESVRTEQGAIFLKGSNLKETL
jgi:hypothetical protein